MNKNQLFVLAFTIFSFSLFAQKDAKVKVSWGGEYFLPKKHLDLGFLGNEKDGYVQIGHAKGKSLSIQRFDNTYKVKSEKFISLKDMPKDYYTESLIEFGGKYYWFFSTYERKDGVERLWVQEINVVKGDFAGGARELLNSKIKLTGTLVSTGFYQLATAGKWKISASLGGKKLLVQYRVKPTEKRDKLNKDMIGLFVFDEKLNKIWGKEHTMPYTEAEMDNEDYYVDAEGNVLLLAKVHKLEEKTKDKKKADYHFEVLKWGSNDDRTQIIPFKFEDKFVSEVVIAEDNNHIPLVVGYYSKKKKSSSADGFFVLKVNANGNKLENVFKGTYEFPADVLKQFESARSQRKIDKKEGKDENEVASLRFKDLTVGEDGSLFITGEQYWVTVHIIQTKTGIQYRYTHHYDDIYTSKIGADGELKYVTKIPKTQVATTSTSYWVGGMSFKKHTYNGKQYFLFIDNMKNLAITAGTVPAGHVDGMGGVLMMVGIDDAGKTAKAKLFDFKEEKRRLIVTNFDWVSDNQLITRTFGKKNVSKPFILTFE
jgi:hypothetical protein